MQKIIEKCIPLAIIIFTVFTAVLSDSAAQSIKSSLAFCLNCLIPALVPMTVMSYLMSLYEGEIFPKGILKRISKTLHINSYVLKIFLLGLISGHPNGAVICKNLYSNKKISKKEAETCIAVSNNASPGFVISYVGASVLHSAAKGVLIFALNSILSFVFLCSMPHSKIAYEKSEQRAENKNFVQNMVLSIQNSCESILKICSNVVFFSMVCDLFMQRKNTVLQCYLCGITEISKGIKYLSNFGGSLYEPAIVSCIGFSGICVIFQVASAVSGSGLSVKKFVIVKSLYAILLPALYFLMKKIFSL